MINNLSFTIKPIPKVCFGEKKLDQLPEIAGKSGSNLLIITGRSSFAATDSWTELQEKFKQNGNTLYTAAIGGEPTPADIDTIVDDNRQNRVSCVIAIGGGSVLDTGKAVAAMLEEEGPVKEFLEGVGTKPPSGRTKPFIAVPTTSGTGSEATANSVITQMGENGFKKSLRHDNFIPDIALIDPELTTGCSAALTAACGMDCFTQLVEGYLSTNSSPYTDSLAIQAISSFYPAIQLCFKQPDNIEARAAVSYSAFISGVVLANAGLGTVHGCAPNLGSMFGVPHGVACGTLMVSANRVTLDKLTRQAENQLALKKYANLGKTLSKEENKSDDYYQEQFIELLNQLTSFLEIPSLSELNIPKDSLPVVAEKTANKNNPVALNQEEVLELLKMRY